MKNAILGIGAALYLSGCAAMQPYVEKVEQVAMPKKEPLVTCSNSKLSSLDEKLEVSKEGNPFAELFLLSQRHQNEMKGLYNDKTGYKVTVRDEDPCNSRRFCFDKDPTKHNVYVVLEGEIGENIKKVRFSYNVDNTGERPETSLQSMIIRGDATRPIYFMGDKNRESGVKLASHIATTMVGGSLDEIKAKHTECVEKRDAAMAAISKDLGIKSEENTK